MSCKKCGADISENDKICPNCGEVFEEEIIDVNEESSSVINEVTTPETSALEEVIEIQEESISTPRIEEQASNEVHENILTGTIKKKNNKLKLIIGIAIILILVICLIGYFFVAKTPKNVFVKSINSLYATMNSNKLPKTIDSIKGTMTLKTDIVANDESMDEVFDLINKMDFQIDFGIDYKSKTMNLGFDSNYDNEELIKLGAYLQNNNAYISLGDIFDKYIKAPVDGYDELFTQIKMTDDHYYIIKEITNAINSSLKTKYFTKESTKITVDGKEVSATKNILTLNNENLKLIIKDVLNYLNNDEFTEKYSKINGISKAEVKLALESYLTNIDTMSDTFKENDNEIVIAIYTTGLFSKFAKIDIAVTSEDKTSIVEVTKNSDTNYSIKETEDGAVVSGSLDVIEKDNKTTYKIVLSDDTGVKFGFTIGFGIEYNVAIDKPNIDDSIDFNNVTEEDYTTILNNLKEKPGIGSLVQTITALMSSTSDNSFDDYNDYDYDDYDYIY